LLNDTTEYQIRDRFSCTRFLWLELQDAVFDTKTIWQLRAQPTKSGVIDELLEASMRI
jgi:hypothetical protein